MIRLPTPSTVADLFYRVLLLAYPAAFRREFAPDMLQLFKDRRRALSYAALRRFLFLAFSDALSQGALERVERIRTVARNRKARLRGPNSRQTQIRKASTMDTLWQDIRYSFRSLRREPGIIIVAIVSLALGIGANATIFSAVDVFMLQPLPLPDADDLYYLYTTNQERGWTRVNLSVPDFVDYRSDIGSLDIAAADFRGYSLSGDERPERLSGRAVSWNFFRVVGTGPVIGRAFLPEEENPGQDHVAILSDGLWHRRFGADPAVLGQALTLDGESYSVVGVLPPMFWFEDANADIWTPLSITGGENRRSHTIDGIARLVPGATEEAAQLEVEQVASGITAAFPEASDGNGARIAGMHGEIFDQGFREGSMIASVAVAFVLLIACANVANLFLTRAAGREREIALRGALGAARLRIARQLLSEALLVGVLSGMLGLAVAVAGIRGLVSIMPPNFPRVGDIGIDGRVLLFTLGISLITGIVFGLIPALQCSQPNLSESLKEGGRTGSGAKAGRTRKALVIAEMSLALVLLVSSALLVQGFMRLRATDLGFNSENVLTFRITLQPQAYPDSQSVAGFHLQLTPRLEALPGVGAVSATSMLPLHGNSATFYTIPGSTTDEDDRQPIASYRYVLPKYFETMKMPMVAGRDLTGSDVLGAPRALLVNETMAERHWPNDDAIGQQIEFASGRREIVGVVADSREWGPDSEVAPLLYFPALQSAIRSLAFTVRSTGDPLALAGAVRAEVAALDPNLPVYNVFSLADRIAERTEDNTIMAKVMAVLALVALVLAIVGVYGVMAHSVAQRTQEMGIRMALGAQRGNVVTMVVRQGALLALTGVGVGIVIALGVTKGLSFFLFGVNPFDPITFGIVAATLLGSGLAATYLPARRATKVDPVIALRAE